MNRHFLNFVAATVLFSSLNANADDQIGRAIVGGIVGGLLQGLQNLPEPRSQQSNVPRSDEVLDRKLDSRAEIQHRLNLLGYEAGYPDGVFGGQTREAISQFQRSIHAPVTGKISEEQIAILYRKTGAALPANTGGLALRESTRHTSDKKSASALHAAYVEPPATEVSADPAEMDAESITEVDASSKLRAAGALTPSEQKPSETVDNQSDGQQKSSDVGVIGTPPAREPESEVTVDVTIPASALAEPTITQIKQPSTNKGEVTYSLKPGPFQAKVTKIDILGVRLGMTPEEIKEVMASEGFAAGSPSTLTIVREGKIDAATLKTEGPNKFVQGASFRKDDANISEVVNISFVSHLNGNGAYRITREIFYRSDEAKPEGTQFVSTLLEKYGRDSAHSGSVKKVSVSGGGMSGYMSGVLGTTQYTSYDVLDLWWYFSGGTQIQGKGSFEDELQITLTGNNPTVGKISMRLESKEIYDRDKAQMEQAASDASALAKAVPRAPGVLPKL